MMLSLSLSLSFSRTGDDVDLGLAFLPSSTAYTTACPFVLVRAGMNVHFQLPFTISISIAISRSRA
jgi:hypothetical protein